MEKSNKIKERSFNFALSIIALYRELNIKSEFVLSKQLLRSGTSIGANVHEASAASSKRDFLNKMSIASKEARETEYWLKLLSESNLFKIDFKLYLLEIVELNKILTSIVKTTKESLTQGSALK
ncbi:MAG: four helix bundle protein [Melioribacteraceae bacterium]